MNPFSARVGIAVATDPTPNNDSPYDEALVAALVRESMLQAGLGQKDPNVPLADIIQPEMTVLLKPNWVMHHNYSGQGMDCMVTHPTFIQVVLKEVLAARPGKVIIGDAPIQDCQFDLLVSQSWRSKIQQIANCPVEFIDFRRTVLKGDSLLEGVEQNLRDDDRYVLFDLGKDSLLEPVSTPRSRFRVTKYDPDELAKTHYPGQHQYLLCREAFEVDVILNLPKLKTHRKAGLTAALKNLVGMNGNKDYLPHHRVGGSALGGDCYPGFSPLKRTAEFCLDNANRHIGEFQQEYWYKVLARLMRWQQKIGNTEIEGGWYGNDTVWRMVLDLNRLLLYGRSDGTLSHEPLRCIYSLTDAIVAGEAEGPLAPEPIHLGVVTFSSSSPYADLVHTALMSFDWKKIPVVREAFQAYPYPLTTQPPEKCEVYYRNQKILLHEVADNIGKAFRAARGWQGYIEATKVTL